MPSVPLMRARPSLAASSTGVSPAAASASAAGRRVPDASRTSPSPISARAQCDSGARSPEQPSEPYSRTTGVMPAESMSAISRAVSRRTPVCPVASVDRRSSISARTTSRSTSGPEPAACERTSERCSWARISVGMCRVARAPNPVEMPYAGVGAAASSSTTARARSMADSASSPIRTAAPSRATARTSAKETGPVPTVTAGGEGVWLMASSNPAAAPGDRARRAASSRIRDEAPGPFGPAAPSDHHALPRASHSPTTSRTRTLEAGNGRRAALCPRSP